MVELLFTWGAVFLPCAIALAIAGATFGGSLMWLYDIFAVACLILGLTFMGKGIKLMKKVENTKRKEQKEFSDLINNLPNAINQAVNEAFSRYK